MMNLLSLYRTLTKNPKLLPPTRLSPLSLSSYFITTKSPSEKQAVHHALEKDEVERAIDWPRPGKIPFQSKVANSVNLIGTVRMPVQFVTSADGKSWAGTVISQEQYSNLPLLWIPIIFSGELAHTAARHLKEKDNVYIAGRLCPDPLPINLTNGQVNVQVMVNDLHFVRGSHHMKKNR